MRFVTMVACWACALTLSAAPIIRIGHDSQENTPVHQAMLFFKEKVEQGSAIKVEIYPARQLGGVKELTELVQQGNLQMTFGASVLLTSYVPEFNVLDLFFLFESEQQAYAALDNPEIGGLLLENMARKGLHGLGYMEVGFRHITNNRGPINSLSDLRGLKIRAANNPTQIKAWKSVGTLPVPLSWGEIFTSLQQGLIRSQESAAFSVKSERFYEVQDYLTLTGHIYTNYVWYANAKFWNKLKKSERSFLEPIIAETVSYQRNLAREDNLQAVNELKKLGMQVNEMPAATKLKMKQLMNDAVRNDIRERTGAELYDKIMATLANM